MKYVKNNFFAARRDERSADVLGPALSRWLVEVAGTRIHGTIRERPLTLFETVECAALRPLPARRAEFGLWHQAQVHRDCHVVFRGAMYSAPWRLVSKKVWVDDTSTRCGECGDGHRLGAQWRRETGIELFLPA